MRRTTNCGRITWSEESMLLYTKSMTDLISHNFNLQSVIVIVVLSILQSTDDNIL